ncbi:HD domain-containing protein [Vibrio sp. S17_S38]|uniref:HD-GYP domain-containing protein n=1 Tax=Vibrio sp. S17_S38 TaxID=2720229 RepID=UPI001680E1EF|nr:HD domain-containing phosphohydrolase [Vibrio sp. S17_S38]MBD1572999.1 HD domain-containing protein [Vibrio sp. S17_S38]
MSQPLYLDFDSPIYINHIQNTACYTSILVAELAKSVPSITDEFQQAVILGAKWHDIGKKFIPKSILSSPNKLNRHQFLLMKKHPELGLTYFNQVPHECDDKTAEIVRDIILYHHEKYDGSGYPLGLSENDIPLAARIVTIADVFEALTTSNRTYREANSFDNVKQHIIDERGKSFDPTIVDAFLNSAAQWQQQLKDFS